MEPDYTSPVEPRKPGDGLGWIKLYRSLLDHPRFDNGDWLKVWLCLLLKASHQSRSVVFAGAVIELRPGQLITSRAKLAEKTRVQESKVERLLKTLETEQQIEQQASNTNRLVTIINWEVHQKYEQQNELRVNNERTMDGQPPDTNKNEEKGKADKKENKKPAVGGASKGTGGTFLPEVIQGIYEAYPTAKRNAETPTPAEEKAIRKALAVLSSKGEPDAAASLLESVRGYKRYKGRSPHFTKSLFINDGSRRRTPLRSGRLRA